MKKPIKAGKTFSLIAFLLSISTLTQGYTDTLKNMHMVVFVHGAHLTADSWKEIEHGINKEGYQSMAINLPGRKDSINPKDITLNTSASFLCKKVSELDKKITFVTHSQGGAIVNHAQSVCPQLKVERIIYLASVSPLTGEKPFDKLNKEDEVHYYKGVSYEESSGLMVISNQDAFVEAFSSKQNSQLKKIILDSAVNEPAYIADGVVKMNKEKFSVIKKFYIFTKNDKIISLASQHKIEKQLKTIKTSTINSGHIPMITHPENLVSTLLEFLVI
ncbi:MAG: alpha/beta hydrolase [Bermanella sp.]